MKRRDATGKEEEYGKEGRRGWKEEGEKEGTLTLVKSSIIH